MRCAIASVLAIATWDRKRPDPQYRDGLLSDTWEVVVRGLVFESEPQSPFDRDQASPLLVKEASGRGEPEVNVWLHGVGCQLPNGEMPDK